MNLKPFAQNTPGSRGLFFSVAVPITLVSMLIVLNWTWLVSVATKYGKLPFRKAVYVLENRVWYLRKLYGFLLESDEATWRRKSNISEGGNDPKTPRNQIASRTFKLSTSELTSPPFNGNTTAAFSISILHI